MFRAERRGSRIPKPLVSSHTRVFDGRGSNLEPSTPSTRCAKNLKIISPSILDVRTSQITASQSREAGDRVYRELVRRSCQILAVGGGRREDVLPREAALSDRAQGWRKDHPHGFVAKPATMRDGSLQLLRWECKVPGKAGTHWEGACTRSCWNSRRTTLPSPPGRFPRRVFPPQRVPERQGVPEHPQRGEGVETVHHR